MKLYVGKKMRMVPDVHIDRLGRRLMEDDMPCKVVYINRKHRFFTVEFKFPGGSFRESYKYTEWRDLPWEGRAR